MTDFPRIARLPPYVFNGTTEPKMAARRRGEDISIRRRARSAGAMASANLPAPRARFERRGKTMTMRQAVREYPNAPHQRFPESC
jgi:hypothetical protein